MSVVLFVGTRRGLFRYRSDSDRRSWRRAGFHIPGHEIYHATLDRESGRAWAAAVHPVWGTHVYGSEDGGESWESCEGRPAFPEGAGREVEAVWHIAVGRTPDGRPRLWAGVAPAALFHSDDGGATWHWHEALDRHPTRTAWEPAKGGLALHSVQPDPVDPNRLFVALSAGGCYRTVDGGESWTAINRGVRADFLPEPEPEAGQCVHSIRLHPRNRNRLYQQNHCGTYRSDDGGGHWIEITEGLPSDYGYVVGLDPADPDRCWVIPEEGSHLRSVCDRKLRVFETTDAGNSWTPRTEGLPQSDAWVTVLREALATESEGSGCGVHFGTATGHLFASGDGASFRPVASHLPKILSVEAFRID
ncbi:MAG: WD40/YVTN/BNR-like repeat-containing protein [Gemmatimonadota bacterium]